MIRTLGILSISGLLMGAACQAERQEDRYITDGDTSCGTSSSFKGSGSANVDLARIRAIAAGADPERLDALSMPEGPIGAPGASQSVPEGVPVLTAPGEVVWLHEGKCGGIIWNQ